MDTVKLRVESMICGHCEIAITDAVRKLPGIKKAKASKRKKEVSVVYDGSLTTSEEIVAAIDSTGYQVIQ